MATNNSTPKTDKSIHTLCLAKLQNSVMWDKCDSKYSLVYWHISNVVQIFNEFGITHFPNELPICSCKIDKTSWSLVTSRRIITSKHGNRNEMDLEKAQVESYGNAKNFNEPYTLGTLYDPEKEEDVQFFIENGYCCQLITSVISERVLLQKNSEELNQRKIVMLTKKGTLPLRVH